MAVAQESCCLRCVTFLITIGMTALFLWLSLRVDEPKCYLDYIYVPALNKTLNNSNNATVLFAIRLVNGNKEKGIRYDDVSLSFRVFNTLNITRPLAYATLHSFYQGHNKKATKRANFTATANFAAVHGKVWYRVDYVTSVKYKILFWYSKRHSLWGGANLEINQDSGLKVHRKAVRLGGNNPVLIPSGASPLPPRYHALLLLLLPFSLFVLFPFL